MGDELAVETALLLLSKLEPQTQDRVRRRLAIKLKPAASPVERREQQVGLVADLLRGVPPPPGWSFPYVARKKYDAARDEASPSSASLVSKYGSWVEVCRRAHDLETRKAGATQRLRPNRSRRATFAGRYTERDASEALRACAQEIQRAPSKHAYDHWRTAAAGRRRGSARYPSTVTVSRLYKRRGGWLAALEDAGLLAPPAATLRIVAATKAQAAALVMEVRAQGLIANHSGCQTWFEVRAVDVAELRRVISDCAEGLFLDTVCLWDPDVRQLEELELPRPARPAELVRATAG